MKRLLPLFGLLVLLLAGGTRQAHAQFSIGPHVGWNFDVPNEVQDDGNLVAGLQVFFHLPVLPVTVNPSFDYYLSGIDGVSMMQYNLNGVLELAPLTSPVTPFVGAGLGVTKVSGSTESTDPTFHESSTDLGLNVLGGLAIGDRAIRPFMQLRYTMGNHLAFYNDEDGEEGSGLQFMGGIMFHIGR